jgi:hypothetical protein
MSSLECGGTPMIRLVIGRWGVTSLLALAAMGTLPSNAAERPAPATVPQTPVTLQAAGEPVVDLLLRLPVPEGQSLTATETLGERRVDVFVAALPPAKLRRALADVVDGMWVRQKKSEALRLEPDPAALRERDLWLAQRKQRFFDGLRALTQNLSLDKEGIERLRQTDSTAAYYLTRPGNRAAIQLTALLGPRDWQELEATGRLTVTPEQLGPQGKAVLREYAQFFVDQQREFLKNAPPDGNPPDPLPDPEEMSRNPLRFLVDGEGPPDGEPYSTLGVSLRQQNSSMAMVITGSAATNAPGPRWTELGTAAPRPVPDGPLVSLSFKTPPATWSAALRRAAEALHLQVVSEEFTRLFPPSLDLDAQGRLAGSLPEVLDRLCKPFGYQWRLKDGVYEFRSGTWYSDRLEEPPGTLIKAAQIAGAAKRPLDLDWLARAVGVSGPNASQRLWSYAPAAQMVAMQFRAPLQLYAALSTEQRAALAGEAGLDTTALPGRQRDLVSTMVRYQQPSWPVETTVVTRLRLTRTDTAARFEMTAGARKGEVEIRYPPASRPPFGE